MATASTKASGGISASRLCQRDKLVNDHIGLVKDLALKYGGRNSDLVDDLIQGGCVGLIEAADRFDPSRGLKFSTYATIKVRGAIIDTLRMLTPIGSPNPPEEATEPDIEGRLIAEDLLDHLCGTLTDSELEVVQLRWQVGHDEPIRTLPQVADLAGISRTTVQQLLKSAKAKMKARL